MLESEINELAEHGYFNGSQLQSKLEETHISWVLFTDKYAFKVKKPLKLSFLDFSTLELRKKYCEREVQLNSRFTDIYMNVVSLRYDKDKWQIGGKHGEIMDYAVQMKKMAAVKRMDKLLMKRKVTEESIHNLAVQVAGFHQKAERIYDPFSLTDAMGLFNDISGTKDFVSKELGPDYVSIIDNAIRWSNAFLKQHMRRFQQRIEEGFKRDVHGDLHSGNVFLYKKPVMFDCIEFNDSYRRIDVLYEVAFMCMDLEAFGQNKLSDAFLKEYNSNLPSFEVEEDKDIFNYFKCLRANVRAKVHALNAVQEHEEAVKRHINETKKYLKLMSVYMQV